MNFNSADCLNKVTFRFQILKTTIDSKLDLNWNFLDAQPMSTHNINHNNEECLDQPCKQVEMIIKPKERDLGGGFRVRRLLPYVKKRMVGPWIFFDQMGPAHLSSEDKFDVRPHPHINLATVTYLFEGEVLHRDSLGNDEVIKPGEINLMVAGKGITHSERERPELRDQSRKISGLQLWMALPEKDEERDPSFHHYDKEEIPSLNVGSTPVRILIGSAYGQTSPVKTFCETLYIEAKLKKGEQLKLPLSKERALYVVSGQVKIENTKVEAHHMAILNEQSVSITATEDSFVAVIGGEPLSKRYIEWNFVSSKKERIEQAKIDWRAGNFPKVPGDSSEFIPLPK